MAWNSNYVSGSVLNATEMNNMVDEIEHNADGTDWYSMDAASDIILDAHDAVIIKDDGTQMFKFRYDTERNWSTLCAGAVSVDNLVLRANSEDVYPYIQMAGSGNLDIRAYSDIYFTEQDTQMAKFSYAANRSTIAGGNANGDDLTIVCNTADTNGEIFLDTGTDVVKFGTYTEGAATDSTGYITIKDAAGNSRKLMVQA